MCTVWWIVNKYCKLNMKIEFIKDRIYNVRYYMNGKVDDNVILCDVTEFEIK